MEERKLSPPPASKNILFSIPMWMLLLGIAVTKSKANCAADFHGKCKYKGALTLYNTHTT